MKQISAIATFGNWLLVGKAILLISTLIKLKVQIKIDRLFFHDIIFSLVEYILYEHLVLVMPV